MILSVWIDHLHQLEPGLAEALHGSAVVQHPMIIGELALGSLRERQAFLDLLASLRQIQAATYAEVMHLVEERQLYAQGLSVVDAHILAALLLTAGVRLWTRDKSLTVATNTIGDRSVGRLRQGRQCQPHFAAEPGVGDPVRLGGVVQPERVGHDPVRVQLPASQVVQQLGHPHRARHP